MSLSELEGWEICDDAIVHRDRRFFEIIQIEVELQNREIPRWDQPIASNQSEGLVGLICQKKKGVMQFLIQAKSEPCHFDHVELTAPSIVFPMITSPKSFVTISSITISCSKLQLFMPT